jgi:valyl-tRNA synthetase
MEFPKRYDPSGEHDQYQRWEDAGAFQPIATSRTGEHFSIVLPPPNVTGTLHVGHAVMLAIEDMMVRYHRMKGDRTVWIPGLDHAAIATQNVVEKKLKKEKNETRHRLGREAFLKEVDAFVEQSKSRIIEQTRAMGASLDWSRLAYTLDDQRSHAVRTMFTMMYDAGVLYRGNRIVNWCPRCKSTLADDEVEYCDESTPFYYFRYGPVVIGTARPETKFLDKTLVVHPDDERYTSLQGTEFEIDWIDGALTSNVIVDEMIDPTFGTGAMTITPAHSFDDFELAQKYDLPVVTIIDEDGNLTKAAGSFAGRNAREAREDIVAALDAKGLVDRVDEQYSHRLSVCYRCATPIEPLPKLQWFVDVNKPFRSPLSSSRASEASREISQGDNGEISPLHSRTHSGRNDNDHVSLKELALAAVRSGAIEILPKRFEKEYFHWMENLRDWCISRQIWFGHRIPAWYRGDETYVGTESPEGDGWEQDPDTLDTWFSSGMWTFSTLGWPKETDDLKAFHPTSVLETGYDILFFWIARMILMTEFALGTVPFTQVYLHGLVRDGKGRKMSKSLGNVIDPLDVVERYGADAVRLALFIGTSPGADSKLDEQKIAGYQKFVTKIWNIARYVMMTIGETKSTAEDGELSMADRWILTKRAALLRDVTLAYEQHEYARAAQMTYDFAWHEFADWYIEATKVLEGTQRFRILTETLDVILKLLHPAMPYVTEALWSQLGHETMLIMTPWPVIEEKERTHGDDGFVFLQEVVTMVRAARSEAGIAPKDVRPLTWATEDERERAWMRSPEVAALLTRLARASSVGEGTNGRVWGTVQGTTIYGGQ